MPSRLPFDFWVAVLLYVHAKIESVLMQQVFRLLTGDMTEIAELGQLFWSGLTQRAQGRNVVFNQSSQRAHTNLASIV